MADTVSASKRSDIMRQVKSDNTTPELVLRKGLWKKGLRGWRLHSKKLPGKPDIVFGKNKLAVFVDGCFWHGCPKCYRRPNSKREYWDNKLTRNIGRDKLNEEALVSLGWQVLRFWEHEVLESVESCASRILQKVTAHTQ